jgi:hypothetical protein
MIVSRNRQRVLLLQIGLFGLVFLGGCAGHSQRLRDIRFSFYQGDLGEAREQIETHLETGNRKEADVLQLDGAMVDLCSGVPRQAEQRLLRVRDHFEEYEKKKMHESALAMLTDDTAVSYAGEDYEKVMVRVFLALSDLMDDGDDASAYALQVVEKQDQIVQAAFEEGGKNPKLDYKRIAFAPYLRGAIREQTHVDYDDAVRSYTQVVNWEPGFQQAKKDLHRAKFGHHSEAGHGVVYVFTLIGRGPYKEQINAEATQVSLLIADRILSATNKYSLPPTVAPVPVPIVVRSPCRLGCVGISVDGRSAGVTETITHVGQMAVDQHRAIFPRIVARAIVRRVVKKGTIYGIKEAVQVENPYTSLALDVAGVIWEATEKADTRCWGLLPDRIQVLRLELPEGTHRIGLQSLGHSGHPISRQYFRDVRVLNGRNTYVLATFPDDRLVGRVLTNEPSSDETAEVVPAGYSGDSDSVTQMRFLVPSGDVRIETSQEQ